MNPIVMPYINGPEMTYHAAQDCLDQTLPSTLLLIDNGSALEGRETAERLRFKHPGRVLTWHHDPPFPSLSAVWNRALRFCWEAGAEQALVVNNDVRLAPWTYELLLEVQRTTGAWFVTAVSVTEPQYQDYARMDIDHARLALGVPTESRKDGIKVEGYSYGGPDFSCYLITRECHRWFQFDEAFVPAYHEDNDYHRRLRIAGFDDRIFGVNLPFWHIGSGTLKTNPQIEATWGPRFARCQEYYVAKWGGLPGKETHLTPFNQDPAAEFDPRIYSTGQGRPGLLYKGTESWPWGTPATA